MQHHHLAAALDRHERGGADDVGDLVGRDPRTGALDLADVGVPAGKHQPRIAAVGIVVPGQQERSEGPCRFVLGAARRPDEEVCVHRVGGGAG